MDHVSTQLPYALISAGIAAIGYFVLGITGSVWIGLAAVILHIACLFTVWTSKRNKAEVKATSI